MSDEGHLFLQACGASGPLRFEWTDPETTEFSQQIDQAALVVGRDPAADLVLDDLSVEPYHAYLQIVDGRLFALDLESTGGLWWGEIPRAAGWVNRGQPLKIGRYTIRLVEGDRKEDKSAVQPVPTSSRYVSRLNPPEVVLECRVAPAGKDGACQRDVLDRILVMAGSSERCKLRVEGRNVAKFICALIRTPEGLWMTNVIPTVGATINGAYCRFARLEDDDVVQLGNAKVRVLYNERRQTPSDRAPMSQAIASHEPASLSRAVGRTAVPVGDLSPEIFLQPWLLEAAPGKDSQSSSFGQALVMMVRLLGDVHRDHLTLVRDELSAIRRLGEDMAQLRDEKGQLQPGQLSLPQNGAARNGTGHLAGDSALPEVTRRPDPQAVPEMISERLEAWEHERRNRWRRLLKLLIHT